MTYFSGKYDGEWKEGLREGFGIYKYNNDEKYIGTWINDLEEEMGDIYIKMEIYLMEILLQGKKMETDYINIKK